MSINLSESDVYMLTNGEERDFYLSCGCWSGDADHRCGPMFDRCRGCGVPDDCMCHESCEPGHACYICKADYRATRDSDHAEALTMLSEAPPFVPGIGWTPGDPGRGAWWEPRPAPWWWDRPESWEYQRYAAGKPVRAW